MLVDTTGEFSFDEEVTELDVKHDEKVNNLKKSPVREDAVLDDIFRYYCNKFAVKNDDFESIKSKYAQMKL